MWYSVYLEVIFLMVIWRKGSSKQRLKSGHVRINLNRGALALNSYSHRSIPAHRSFCWAMKIPGMEIRSLNNSRCDSVMKVFMAEQSQVPRPCAWGLQTPPITESLPRGGSAELILRQSVSEVTSTSFFLWFYKELAFLKENQLLYSGRQTSICCGGDEMWCQICCFSWCIFCLCIC